MFKSKFFYKSIYQQVQQCRSCSRKATENATRVPHRHKMQAWQIHSYGGINELQLTTARIPHITNPNELLIKIKATSLNPIDSMMMNGYGNAALEFMRGYDLEFPLTLGREYSGTVIDKGRNISSFKIGDNVYGVVPLHKQGSHAEYLVTDAAHSLLQPTSLKATEAASILFAALTAWSSLFITGELALRDPQSAKVLVLGASGSVGAAAVQILKSQRSLVVGTCAKDAVSLVQSLGADQVYDYINPGHVHEVLSHGIFDIILDCANLGYKSIPNEWKCKKYISLDSPLGRNLDKYGLAGGVAVSISDIVIENCNVFSKGHSIRWGFFLSLRGGLDFINKLVSNKQLLPVIHKVYKFNEIQEAYKALSTGHLRGKIVIDLQ